MTMGTASTMACMADASASHCPPMQPSPPSTCRYVLAHMTGRRITDMVREDLRISKILAEAFENAIMANGAIGGSTNAMIHLLAIAGRVGVDLSLDDWDRLGRDIRVWST